MMLSVFSKTILKNSFQKHELNMSLHSLATGRSILQNKWVCKDTVKINNLVFDLCIVALKKRKKSGEVRG